MTAKSTFWSKQKSHKTNETMICTKCNGIEIKQTSTIGMIFVGFVILMFIPFTRVFGFIGFGIFAVLIVSGYRPVMRDCLKCKAKGDKIVPVSDVKGKMLFETYHADKVADNKVGVELKKKRMGKLAKFVIIIFSILIAIGTIAIINDIIAERKNPGQRAARIANDAKMQAEKKAAERKANYKAKIVSVTDAQYTVVKYEDDIDMSNDFRNLWSLNHYICHVIFQELRGRLDEVTHEEVVLMIASKNMEVRDAYGNISKEDVNLLQLMIAREDISKFNCENYPDIFTAVQSAAFKPIARNFRNNIIQDCHKQISEGNHSKTQLCRFL